MPLYLKVVLPIAGLILGILSLTIPEGARSQQPTDAIAQAQTDKDVTVERPEQKKTAHDLSDVFNPSNAVPSSEALTNQQDRGEMRGFDFYRDPLGAMRPGMTFEDVYKAGVAIRRRSWRPSAGSSKAGTTLNRSSTRSSKCRAASPLRWVLQRDCRLG